MKRIFVLLLFITIGCISQGPPQFEECSPEETALSVSQGTIVEFSCTASDPDTEEEQLTYTWYVNGEKVSDTSRYDFEMTAGDYTVLVEVSDGRTTISHQWDVTVVESPDLEKIQNMLERIRGLKFLESVSKIEISRDQLREYLIADLDEDLEVVLADQSLLRAFHVLEPEADLYQLYADMLTVQVASYYNIKDHTFYEVVDPYAPLVYREYITVHELIHALQDQHYHLDREYENDDEYLAYMCVIEGDAMYHQFTYLEEMTISERRDLSRYLYALDIPVINPFLENLFMLEYDLGYEFVSQVILYSEDERSIDQLYEQPPVSTEQIIHLDKYLTYELPVSVDIPSVPGWEKVSENVFGEAVIMIILAEHIDADKAAEAVAGWGGDAYGYYEQGDTYLLILNTFWDTETDAAEFSEAYYDFTVAWSEKSVKKVRDNIYETPTGFLALIQEGKQVIIIESPSLEAVTEALSLMRSLCAV